jgi:hypothetical protein
LQGAEEEAVEAGHDAMTWRGLGYHEIKTPPFNPINAIITMVSIVT